MADEIESATCERVGTNLGVHSFSEELMDKKVNFQVVKMSESLFLWMGTGREIANLAVAMCTKYVSFIAFQCIFGTITYIYNVPYIFLMFVINLCYL